MSEKRSMRYGIAEWYGHDIVSASQEVRRGFAEMAHSERTSGIKPSLPCPFLGSIKEGALCNKSGGVCSARPYSRDTSGGGIPESGLVTLCPNRFLEEGNLLRWVAEVMLGTSKGILAVKETPFLKRTGSTLEDDDQSKAGRIDWIFIDPDTMKSTNSKWCALETQSLYFSGHNMTDDFERYRSAGNLIFPTKTRRPDYRSGGPKRLSPQLTIKVPLLAKWGIKTAVLVDRYFFNEMSSLQEITYGDESDRLSEAELVWFVCEYSSSGALDRGTVHYASLDDSIKALNAAQPIARREFVQNLEATVTAPRNLNTKFFKLS